MDFLEIHGLMAALSSRRPVFHSEADFQHELAWQIRATFEGCPARLEFPPFPDRDTRMALDIWLPAFQVAIELKYFTRRFDRVIGNERFSLANQAARDHKRYDLLKDVQRIERVVAEFGPAKSGFAVLLTNDSLCWDQPSRTDVVDAAFHIQEGRRVGDHAMSWGNSASVGTIRSREEPITLSNPYVLKWHDYSVLGNARGEQFRYLAIEVPSAQEQAP